MVHTLVASELPGEFLKLLHPWPIQRDSDTLGVEQGLEVCGFNKLSRAFI